MKAAVMLFLDKPLPVLSQLAPGQAPDPLALALLRDTLRNLADVEADVFVFLEPEQDKEQARALLLSNAMPDLPGYAVQSALDSLGWKCCCLGPVLGEDGTPDQLYAMGFDFEGYTTDALDMVDFDRPKVFERLETLLLFYERKVKVLAPYSPVSSLDAAPKLAARCADTRFALLPSVRLAGERATASPD